LRIGTRAVGHDGVAVCLCRAHSTRATHARAGAGAAAGTARATSAR
jgi:hypothetical protein